MTDRWISRGFAFGRRGWRGRGAGECEKTPPLTIHRLQPGGSSGGVAGWGCSACGQQGFTYEVWTLIRDQLQPLQTPREKKVHAHQTDPAAVVKHPACFWRINAEVRDVIIRCTRLTSSGNELDHS